MPDTATKPKAKKGGFAAFIAAKGDKQKKGVKAAAKKGCTCNCPGHKD